MRFTQSLGRGTGWGGERVYPRGLGDPGEVSGFLAVPVCGQPRITRITRIKGRKPGRRGNPISSPVAGFRVIRAIRGCSYLNANGVLDASPQTTPTTRKGQCFSVSVLQCFSKPASPQTTPTTRKKAAFLLFAFRLQVSSLVLPSVPCRIVGWSDSPIVLLSWVHGLWSLVLGPLSSPVG